MPESLLDPDTERRLDQRVRTARTRLQSFGAAPPPPLPSVGHRDHRRMLLVAAAIVVVLAASVAALATGQESVISTTNTPTPPTDSTTTTTTRPDAPPSTSEPTAAPTTAAPGSTVAPPATEAPPAPDPGARLVGKSFAGATVTEAGRPRPLVAGTEITVTFERNQQTGDDVVRWNAGCNTAGERVVITADRLEVGAEGGSTDMGCPQDRHDQDAWLSSFFHADPAWSLDGATLHLTVEDTVITLSERP